MLLSAPQAFQIQGVAFSFTFNFFSFKELGSFSRKKKVGGAHVKVQLPSVFPFPSLNYKEAKPILSSFVNLSIACSQNFFAKL